MSDETPRGTRSRLGPNADEGMPQEDDQDEKRRQIAEEAEAATAEKDIPSPHPPEDDRASKPRRES